MSKENEGLSAFAPASSYAMRFIYDAESGYVYDSDSGDWLTTAEEVYGAMSIDARRLDWLDKRLDYFGRISLRLQGNPERCIIAEEAPDECGNYHNGDEIGSSAGKLLRSAIDAGMSHNEVAHPRREVEGGAK